MRKKIFVSLLIFFAIFSGASFLNDRTEEKLMIAENQNLHVIPLNTGSETNRNIRLKFKQREYVRIIPYDKNY
ncbi:hypothetical protein H1Z61_02495 [Bacillus aquiflavi]|uniref:Uncharacterized protein n=1 Tax=Bacillus aquiflavi TaxID=2672567 RepID=A0A6B3VXX0_9BACI|nr:hypothetical protein [Bacillus aquiflavi]MBA4536037.1 hypothetical protein [Bacillus aquiflavi]NEY80411.1 hypothetical protein [Bacillus aquiflavi]UAC47679.1 hypothetical protein K6959_13745 [Bacillus aquiflavi]